MPSQKERMLSGQLYKAADPEIRKVNARARKLTRLFNQTTEEQMAYRQELLKELFGQTGDQIYIEQPFHIDYGTHTTIGNHFYANYDCIFIDTAPITIGANVYLAPRVGLYTAGHPIDAAIRNEELEYGYPITIGDNVWIGGNTVVNPGVTIGSNVVIGSGSIVVKDIPDNVVAVGNPCKVLRPITQADQDYWQQQKAAYLADQDLK
ncbi:sugar O-acetyltransferase [Agrilactobacillus fermenti]|uniref:sugar O-acetyltransferase n=1 Tax=Agrilactobacillus fermenti TaxID=2586909 RepID=UPI003A5C7325